MSMSVTVKTEGGALIGQGSYLFTFAVEETPNTPPCKYAGTNGIPCADAITYGQGGFSMGSSFNYSGVEYTLQLIGFKGSNSTNITTQFISDEGGSRTGTLYGRLTY